MAGTKAVEGAADGRLQPISDSRFYIETGGKTCRRWERRHCIFEHEKLGVLFYIRNKDQTGILDFLSDTASG